MVRQRADALPLACETAIPLDDQRMDRGATMAQSTEAFVEAEAAGYTWERRTPQLEDDHLMAHTRNWLDALPKGVRPVQLPASFPRIANELSRLWPDTAALDQYFDDKEFSPRQDRHGFPPLIKEELLAMHVYSLRNRPRSFEERIPHQMSLLDSAFVAGELP
jgi:hypothetical protein